MQPASLSSPSALIGDPDFKIYEPGFPIRIASGMTVCKKAADEHSSVSRRLSHNGGAYPVPARGLRAVEGLVGLLDHGGDGAVFPV
jgi:hypothetical protein